MIRVHLQRRLHRLVVEVGVAVRREVVSHGEGRRGSSTRQAQVRRCYRRQERPTHPLIQDPETPFRSPRTPLSATSSGLPPFAPACQGAAHTALRHYFSILFVRFWFY